MTFETLAQRNTTEGIHTIFLYVNDITSGMFMRLIFVALFIIILFGVYFSQQRRKGDGDFTAAFSIAGFVTFGGTLLASMIPGLIDLFSVVTSLVIAILGALWLLLSNRD